MQGWLATWIAHHDEVDAESAPAYVQRELSAYLECGILAYGFARARCPDCTAEFLVAFSCKGRGVCPSCTTKRMAATVSASGRLGDSAGADAAVGAGFAQAPAPSTT